MYISHTHWTLTLPQSPKQRALDRGTPMTFILIIMVSRNLAFRVERWDQVSPSPAVGSRNRGGAGVSLALLDCTARVR